MDAENGCGFSEEWYCAYFTLYCTNNSLHIQLQVLLGSVNKFIYDIVTPSWAIKKTQFKVALKRYSNTHAFYSVEEFLKFKNKSQFLQVFGI
jgi:hypothetical protein